MWNIENEPLENTMIKSIRNLIAWIMFTLIVVSNVFLVGCHTTKETVVADNELQTQQESATEAPNQKVLIVTGEYVPYVGETLENRGFITKLIEEALDNCDMEYEIKFYPWARCSEMVQSGEAWASFPYGHSELNDQTYLFSDIIYHTTHKFYYLKENEKITEEVYDFNSIGNFTQYIFGGANGYWYGSQEDFETVGVKAEWANNTDALLKMLYSERIDFFIEDELVCNEIIHRLFPGEEDKFETLPQDAKAQDYYLIVSKDYPESQKLLDQFNRSLEDINDNQEVNVD
jgi:polar amino acid transport system substrate-binding protein